MRKQNNAEHGGEDRLWNDQELAAFLGVHPVTPAIWRTKGKGPPYLSPKQDGTRLVRYVQADVMEWVRQNMRDPAERESSTAARPKGAVSCRSR